MTRIFPATLVAAVALTACNTAGPVVPALGKVPLEIDGTTITYGSKQFVMDATTSQYENGTTRWDKFPQDENGHQAISIASVIGTDEDGASAVAMHEALGPKRYGAVATVSPKSDVPTSGSSTYQGQYYANLIYPTEGGDYELGAFMDGAVTLKARFGNDSISGSITERRIIDSYGDAVRGYNVEDLTINSATIHPDGSFAINSSGGKVTYEGTGNSGKATHIGGAGVIGGKDGDYIAGVVAIKQEYFDPFVHTELGVFTAER